MLGSLYHLPKGHDVAYWRDLRQLDIGAGSGFLDELEQYAAAQVVAAFQRGDELALNPDVLRL